MNIQRSMPVIDMILPVGISFYIFQMIAYLTDIYRGKIDAERNMLKFGLFIAFFPKIEAAIEKSYMETEIYSLFPEFYQRLQYYPSEYFEDGIHPKADQQIIQMMIRDIQKNNDCLEDFIVQ